MPIAVATVTSRGWISAAQPVGNQPRPDPLTLVMSLGVVVLVGLYFHRMIQRSRNPTDLRPGLLTVDQFYEQNPLHRTPAELSRVAAARIFREFVIVLYADQCGL